MKTAVIICNGDFPRKEYPRYLIKTADLIVCCDGALQTFLRHSAGIFGELRSPDAVIGDMDSLSPALREKYSHIIIHDPDQETNDQTKAFNYIISNFKDISSIHIIGATGKRVEHTVGNISLLMEYARTYDLEALGTSVDMVYDYGTVCAVTDTAEIHCGKGRKVSIFSPDNTLRIHSEGLEWQTDGVIFDNWWKATLNIASEDVVKLAFSHRSIALIAMD